VTQQGLDCAECRALLDLLAGLDDRAEREVRTLTAGMRTSCRRAALQLARICEAETPAEGPASPYSEPPRFSTHCPSRGYSSLRTCWLSA
jgi:hypothetical protein